MARDDNSPLQTINCELDANWLELRLPGCRPHCVLALPLLHEHILLRAQAGECPRSTARETDLEKETSGL